jgi:hypothetical protein
MLEKKQKNFESPDLSKLQEVIIDFRTKIYVSPDADPEEARSRYLSRLPVRYPNISKYR